MRKTFCAAWGMMWLFGGCATTPSSPPPTESPKVTATENLNHSTTLSADTELSLPSGSSFTASKGWKVMTQGEMTVLTEPDGELSIVMMDATGSDAQSVLSASWKRFQPGFSRKTSSTRSPPTVEGWDEVVQNQYETQTAENRVVLGIALRSGQLWNVVLVDGATAAIERRGAQLSTAIQSLKAKGSQKESFVGRTAKPLDAALLAQLDEFIEESRHSLKVPGVAIALVQHGKRIHLKGFGVRDASKSQPVTPDTLFMIGSTTKSLTTLMMGQLVDEGRFTWETPVTKILPSFALGDADMTSKLQMRHTVCACTGLPREDYEFLFEYAHATPESRVESMRWMKPTTGFGETFQYSNTMVSTGGFVAAMSVPASGNKKGMGPRYDALMQSRVFDVLGMSSTTFDVQRVLKKNHAAPHALDLNWDYSRIPMSDELALDAVRPAGGAWSTVKDLSAFLEVELGRGQLPNGKRVVSEQNLLARRTPQIKITDDLSYGLGLFVENSSGVQVVHHGGNTLGFSSELFFLP